MSGQGETEAVRPAVKRRRICREEEDRFSVGWDCFGLGHGGNLVVRGVLSDRVVEDHELIRSRRAQRRPVHPRVEINPAVGSSSRVRRDVTKERKGSGLK